MTTRAQKRAAAAAKAAAAEPAEPAEAAAPAKPPPSSFASPADLAQQSNGQAAAAHPGAVGELPPGFLAALAAGGLRLVADPAAASPIAMAAASPNGGQPQHFSSQPAAAAPPPSRPPTLEELAASLQASAAPRPDLAKPQIFDIHPGAVETYWPRVEDLIRSAINASPVQPKLETPRDVLELIKRGVYNLHLIVAENAIQMAVVSQIVSHPRTRVCTLVYGAGAELEKYMAMFRDRFAEGAREQGCRFVQIYAASEAHGEILKRCGFEETARVYSVEI